MDPGKKSQPVIIKKEEASHKSILVYNKIDQKECEVHTHWNFFSLSTFVR